MAHHYTEHGLGRSNWAFDADYHHSTGLPMFDEPDFLGDIGLWPGKPQTDYCQEADDAFMSSHSALWACGSLAPYNGQLFAASEIISTNLYGRSDEEVMEFVNTPSPSPSPSLSPSSTESGSVDSTPFCGAPSDILPSEDLVIREFSKRFNDHVILTSPQNARSNSSPLGHDAPEANQNAPPAVHVDGSYTPLTLGYQYAPERNAMDTFSTLSPFQPFPSQPPLPLQQSHVPVSPDPRRRQRTLPLRRSKTPKLDYNIDEGENGGDEDGSEDYEPEPEPSPFRKTRRLKADAKSGPHTTLTRKTASPPQERKRYQCSIEGCLEKFVRLNDVQRHIKRSGKHSTGSKDYSCKYCEVSFKRKDARDRHELKKSCGKRTTRA